MTDAALKAALYLEAVLPTLPALARHDPQLAALLAGPDVAVTLLAPGKLRARLAVIGDQAVTDGLTQRDDLRLWFPTRNQLIRAFENRSTFALPLSGVLALGRAKRLPAAGRRLDTLLNTRANDHLAVHALGNLAVALAGACVWLRRHPDGPATHARLGKGVAVFACPAFPELLWIDLATLNAGIGEPPSPFTVRIEFADLPTALAELDNQLDGPAALGLGTLRVTGLLPLAESLGLVMIKVGQLLKPVNH